MKLCLRCNQYFEETADKCPSDGAILENVGKDPLIGALINNRYLVDSVIGKGSSGIVYKARRLGRGEMVVAIKVLHSYIGAAGSSLDRFLREAQAASRLRNPHIITIWESGVTEDGQPYFVMDYLEGTTLGRLIKDKGNIEPKRVLSLLHQICEALAEAHRQDIVHRDLKPENVVLQESDHGHDYIKLLDFGIADSPQHAQSSFKLEKPRTVSGSPAYMSPEQCQGLELDGRSDIYSLAIVVFEMLTGKRPFSQKDNVNVMILHVNESPMTMSEVRPDLKIPQSVENVIARALSKRPEDRQATVQDFLLEFELAWQDSDNPLSVLSAAAAQPSTSLTNLAKRIEVPKHESEITSDDLSFQGSDGSLAAWGNVSIQSSSKTEVALEPNSVFARAQVAEGASMCHEKKSLMDIWTSAPEDSPSQTIRNNLSEAEINMAPDLGEGRSVATSEMPKTQVLEEKDPSLAVQPNPPQPSEVSQPTALSDNKADQSLTGRNRTIERLMEAAKRGQGQTGAHSILPTKPIISPKEAPSMQPIPLAQMPQSPQLNAMPSSAPLMQSISNINPLKTFDKAVNNIEHISTKKAVSPTASGWFSICDESTAPATNANVPPASTSLSIPTDLPSNSVQGMSASALSQNILFQRDLSQPPLPSNASLQSLPPLAESTRRHTQPDADQPQILSSLIRSGPQSNLQEVKPQHTAVPPSNDVDEQGIYVKQRYRNTISRITSSRLSERPKVNRFDNSLVTTRARAAALKSDSTRPPINLWRIAIIIVASACLLASAYIVYSTLSVPIPPVSSIDTLIASGNHQQVVDILEGKSLSAALTQEEKDQLNYSYLALAKIALSKNKSDQSLEYLSKIDRTSPSAVQANQIRNSILQTKKDMQEKSLPN